MYSVNWKKERLISDFARGENYYTTQCNKVTWQKNENEIIS